MTQKETEIFLKNLGEKIGYGNIMDVASKLWQKDLEQQNLPKEGAFIPVILIKDRCIVGNESYKLCKDAEDNNIKNITDMTNDNITRYIILSKGIIRLDVDKKLTPNVCFISNLFVEELFRNKNIAKTLINEAEKTAKEFGCNVVSLQVNIGSWMYEWYRKLGYIPNVMWTEENVLMVKEI